MNHQIERRKTWWFGLPPSSWITIIILLIGLAGTGIGGVISYARAMDRIDSNTVGRKDDKEETAKQIKFVEKRLSVAITSSEGRLRADMREIRSGIQQILLRKDDK